jgi:hypothetical protein
MGDCIETPRAPRLLMREQLYQDLSRFNTPVRSGLTTSHSIFEGQVKKLAQLVEFTGRGERLASLWLDVNAPRANKSPVRIALPASPPRERDLRHAAFSTGGFGLSIYLIKPFSSSAKLRNALRQRLALSDS